MSPDETRSVLVALRTDDHAFMGIRPADASPSEAPCILLDAHSLNSLTYALVDASQHWPQCHAWALIASDAQLQVQGADWPPRMIQLRQPTQVATFATAAPMADG